jgi:hypothetical protein
MKKKEEKEKTSDNEDFSLMMKTFRLQLNASTTIMSEICGLGENGWRLYEKDSSNIPKSKKNIIRFACTPIGILNLLNLLHISNLSDKKKNKLLEKISLMLLELEKEVFEFKSIKNKNYWKQFL